MQNSKNSDCERNANDELLDEIAFNELFKGLAEGAELDEKEARRATAILLIHNTADFILSNLFQYFFAADQLRGYLLQEYLLNDLDLLKKANTLKKCKVIDDELFKSLAKLNEIRVAIAHGKPKDDPRLKYKGKNILSASWKFIWELDEQTVQRLLVINEKVRRIRIFKDKWPEKPFIYELYDRDREKT